MFSSVSVIKKPVPPVVGLRPHLLAALPPSHSLSRREAAKAFYLQISNMNHCAMQVNALAACEEMRGPFAVVGDRKHPVFCPKPRRLSPLPTLADPARPLRRLPCLQLDLLDRSDSEAGAELLAIFPPKGGEKNQVASSPPFFCGSPPSRAANPVILDARFGKDYPPVPISHLPSNQSSSPMPARIGCAPAKFSYKPASVRIEGFDCLDHDCRQSCSSIAAVA